MSFDFVIVGAGIIGSAIAFELSKRAGSKILVVDADLTGEFSSTERNAGGVRHLWQQPVNIELARHSLKLFHEIADEIGFQKTGYLWLYSKSNASEAQTTLAHAKRFGMDYEGISVAEIRKRYPFIDKTEDLSCAIFGPKDGLINSNALKLYYRNHAKQRGVVFRDLTWVNSVTENSLGVELKLSRLTNLAEGHQRLQAPECSPPGKPTTDETVSAKRVVLATGPWSGPILKSFISDPMVSPIRRQIVLFKSETLTLGNFGMVVDTSRVYFHPEGGNILAGLVLKDEPAGFKFSLDDGFFNSHIWPALHERSSHFERLKPVTGWGGLYSYTPDTSGFIGKVPGTKAVYECHSFTGRGVMQSYGAAIAMTELLLDGKFSTIDARPLRRSRFEEDLRLDEDLHI